MTLGCISEAGEFESFDAEPTTTMGGTMGATDSTSATDSQGPLEDSGSDATTDSGSGGADESTGEPIPPFSCTPAPFRSPQLDGLVLFDPADPHPGDTLNVIVRATNGTSRADAPPMDLEITDRTGIHTIAPLTIQGGDALYYYAIPNVEPGDLCLRSIIGGETEVAARIEVTPRPPAPPSDGGIYKIVRNHQWTCDEQPSNGNEIHVWVRDEFGQGLAGVPVALGYADSTDPGSIYNADREGLPTQIVTGDDGHGMLFNYWPISDNGLMSLTLTVDGVASDIANEITTGWWEDIDGCNYCGTPTVNVWGHWSYTVEFQRDPGASEICVVPTDHEGMAGCEVTHIHHDPNSDWCWVPPTLSPYASSLK